MYKRGEKIVVNERETLEEVMKYPILDIPERSISKKTANHFGIRTAVSPLDGITPIAHYFPYTVKGEVVGFKKRNLEIPKSYKPKRGEEGHFSAIGMVSADCELFGSDVGNSTGGKKVWITEGEYDAAIVWQVLKERYPKANPTVLSIGLGTANAVKHIGKKENLRYLKKFQQIISAFDADKATQEEKEKGIKKGKDATNELYGLIPELSVVDLPEDKDPVEAYDSLGAEQLYWLCMKPISYTPEGFVKFEDARTKAIELPTVGRGWPWPTVMKKTLGRRDGEGYYLGAGVKMGKSEWANKLIEYVVKNEVDEFGNPRKVAVFKFEEQPDETIKKVAGKFYKKDFVNPEKIIFINELGQEVDVWGNTVINKESFFTQEELVTAIDSVGPHLVLYNNYGRCHWDELKGAIRHAVLVEHVKDIFIDPITRLTAGMSASEANSELERFADEISKMSQDLGFTYYCFCHLKAPERGAPHEFGGKVYSAQFRGSRAMMQACHYAMGLEGNKDPELPLKQRNTRYLVITDDRKHGRTARIPLFYDVETGDFKEPPEGFLESPCETLGEFLEMYPNGYCNYEEDLQQDESVM